MKIHKPSPLSIMKLLKKTLRILLVITGLGLLTIIGWIVYYYANYEKELRAIKKSLNSIEGIEVVNIWGHKDIDLEEISARIKVKDKGEIVLFGLSKDIYQYPKHVYLSEIGGMSFSTFTCSGSIGIGSTIDIGTNSRMGRHMISAFNSPEEVFHNYDTILAVIQRLKDSSELGHFVERGFEEFNFVIDSKNEDTDPIFTLINAAGAFEFAKKLNWVNAECRNK